MKFLVMGATGMAGHVVSIYLKEHGHEVVGYSRHRIPYVNIIEGDVRDLFKLESIITREHFDTIINAVGILNQFAEKDHEAAVFLNSYLPHYLAKVTENTNTQVIQMSTDCVFSGRTGPYYEDSFCDGESFYDRSKAVGELKDDKNLTLRNSIVGPDVHENGIGLLNWFMKQKEVKGYTRAMWTGLTTLQLAKVMEAAAEQRAHGLINMVYEKNISKFELLNLFNHYICGDSVTIHPFDEFVVDKTLVRTNFEFKYKVPDYETMIAELGEWMRAHMNLYPHYNL